MKQCVYSLHDTLAGTWSFPQIAINENVAKRDFSKIKTRPEFPIHDVECVLIGSYDQFSGKIESVDHVVLVPAEKE